MKLTMIQSSAIESAVQLASSAGNEVIEISDGWTKVKQVVHMRRPLTEAIRSTLARDPRLRYWFTESTPHNAADEGFSDDIAKVAISFPRG